MSALPATLNEARAATCVVDCQECGVLLLKSKAKEIPYTYAGGRRRGGTVMHYYCAAHTPPFDRESHGLYSGSHYYKKVAPEIEVTKEGLPLGDSTRNA